MRGVLFGLFVFMGSPQGSLYAQCTPDLQTELFTINPNPNSIPCVVNGSEFGTVLQFNLIPANFIPEFMTTVVFDSLVGLPDGMDYEFDKADRIYLHGAKGGSVASVEISRYFD